LNNKPEQREIAARNSLRIRLPEIALIRYTRKSTRVLFFFEKEL